VVGCEFHGLFGVIGHRPQREFGLVGIVAEQRAAIPNEEKVHAALDLGFFHVEGVLDFDPALALGVIFTL
jgi:hypothetical protein